MIVGELWGGVRLAKLSEMVRRLSMTSYCTAHISYDIAVGAALLSIVLVLLGTEVPAKIQEVTLMRPIHGNL